MIRVIALIAFFGFVVSTICLGSAVALGARDVAQHGGWRHANWRFDIDGDHDERDAGDSIDGGGPATTREIAWDGSDTFGLDTPADVSFTQAPGAAKLVITGPKGSLDHVSLDGGRLRFDRSVFNAPRLTVVMSAPSVHRFEVSGDGRLDIKGYRQDRLEVELNGSGAVTAEGQARDVSLDIAGSGSADLGRLASDDVRVNISGSGGAVVAPKTSADIDISGSGGVTLATHPTTLHSDVSGSGRITEGANRTEPGPAEAPPNS